ncbi:MAG: helix-turn-helix domain-containing protein [Bacteroidales bacterium]|nr:helix-turn-helix domain-containing protein [Bacteroidales bacterium]
MRNSPWTRIAVLLLMFHILFLSQGGAGPRVTTPGGTYFDVGNNRLTFLKDLPNKDVSGFIQDSDGYLWIATQNGLYQYDGYHYQVFRSDLNHPGMISGNEIKSVAEDAYRRIRFASTAGLDRYDKRTGLLEHITSPGTMQPQHVSAIITSSDGSVWLGGLYGMWLYRPADQSYICLTQALSDRQTSVGITCLMQDSRGDVWIGTWDMGLFRYERSTGQIVEYPRVNERNSVSSICEDDRHRIWIGSWQCGIQVLEQAWDPAQCRYTTIDRANSGLYHDIIYTLYADHQAHLVFAGTPKGLSMFDSRQEAGTTLRPYNVTHPNGMVYPGEQLVAFRKGRNGLYWAGMQGKGMCAIDPSGYLFDVHRQYDVSFRHGTTGCRSLLSDNHGKLVEGLSTTGFIVRDTTTGQFVSWRDIPEFAQDATMSTIESIVQSRRDGHIWMACLSMYVVEIDPDAPEGKRVTKHSPRECPWLTSGLIYSILEDHDGNLWFGGKRNFSRRGVDGTHLLLDTIYVDDSRTLYDLVIYNMAEDSDGRIWLATQHDGVIRVSQTNGVWTAKLYNLHNGLLQSDNAQCVHVDRKGRVWVGTSSYGLHLYRPDSDTFESLQRKWQIPGDAVNSIVEETASSFWLGTNAGIVSLNLNSDADVAEVRRYQVEDGLQDNIFNRNAATRASDGRIYMGGNLGYNAFYPKYVVERKHDLRVNLTDFLVRGESWFKMPEQKRNDISALSPEYTESFILDYDQNSITFVFSSFDYVDLDRVRYQYMMQGFDDHPIDIEEGRNKAYYSNLTPGYYTFVLGSPDGKYERRVQVYVRPPFWRSWWAYVIYVFLGIALLCLTYYLMRQRMHRMQILRMRVFERARRDKEREAERQASIIAQTRQEMQQQFKQEQQTASDKTKLVFEAQDVEINSSDEEFLRKALELINHNLDNPNYDQQQFIIDMGISKSTCFRKLKSMTGMGFAALIRGVRMNAACRILDDKKGIRVSELAYAVGYSDPRYFSTCFKKEFGMMPSEYADYVRK